MTRAPTPPLYTPEILALAVSLAEHPLTDDLPHRATSRSRLCGSSVTIGIEQADDGSVARCGLSVTACAIGQAAAAIFARGAQGHDLASCRNSATGLERWLAGEGSLPDWPGLAAIESVLVHPGRHGAILLPWRAAVDALSKGGGPR